MALALLVYVSGQRRVDSAGLRHADVYMREVGWGFAGEQKIIPVTSGWYPSMQEKELEVRLWE
jgi:hypothetical protein